MERLDDTCLRVHFKLFSLRGLGAFTHVLPGIRNLTDVTLRKRKGHEKMEYWTCRQIFSNQLQMLFENTAEGKAMHKTGFYLSIIIGKPDIQLE